MTSFEDPKIQELDTIRKSIANRVLSPKDFITGRDVPQPKQAWWQSSLHGLAKFEEWTAKAVGGAAFPDDAKYDFGKDSNYWNQVGFHTIFGDSGFSPVTSALLGFAAAVANPFDPLGKAKIGRLTKPGLMGRQLSNLDQAGQLVKQGKKAFLPTQHIKDRLSILKQSVQTPKVKSSIRRLDEDLSGVEATNRDLGKLYESGLTLDDLKLAPTAAQRVHKGQQMLLGWSSPLKADQLSLAGIHKTAEDAAPVFDLAGLFGAVPLKARAALTNILEKGKEGFKSKGLLVAQTIAEKVMQFPVMKSQSIREVFEEMQIVVRKHAGDDQMMHDSFLNLFNRAERAGITPDEWMSIQNRLEDSTDIERMALKHMTDKFLEKRIKDPKGYQSLVAKAQKNVPDDFDPESLGVSGNIDAKQRAHQTASGLSKSELEDAEKLLPELPIKKVGGKDIWVSGKFVASKRAPNKKITQTSGMKDLGPMSQWSEKNGVWYARRLPGAKVISTNGDGIATNFNESHLDHLTGFMKDIGLKGKVISRLHPDDWLIQDSGAIQLINPSVVIDAKGLGTTKSLATNFATLDNFINNKTFLKMNPKQLDWFRSAKVAKRATKRYGFRRNIHLKSSDEFASVHELHDSAPNMSHHREFMERMNAGTLTPEEAEEYFRSVDGLSSVERELGALLRPMEAGKRPMVKPIELQINHETGLVEILEGRSRLAALKIVGADYAPVRIRKFKGDEINLNEYSLAQIQKVDEFFDSDGGKVRGLDEGGAVDPVVSRNYDLLDSNGKQIVLEKAHLNTETRIPLHRAVVSTLTRGLSKESAADFNGRIGLLLRHRGYNNPQVLFAELAETSDSVEEFVQKLDDIIGISKKGPNAKYFTKTLEVNRKNINSLQGEKFFQESVKPFATKYLDEVASEGVLSDRNLNNGRRVDMAVSGEKTLIALDRTSQKLTYTNSAKTTTKLREFADKEMHRLSTPEDLDPIAAITLEGKEKTLVTRARDYRKDPHKGFKDVYETAPRQILDDGRIKEWKQQELFFNPGDKFLQKRGLVHGVFVGEKITVEGVEMRSHKAVPFLIFREGSMLVTDTTSDLNEMRRLAFKEGSDYSVESGFIKGSTVRVQDVLGSNVDVIGKQEIKVIEKRLRRIGRALKDLGLNDSTQVKITMPFDESVWRKMYGDRVTLGQLTGDKAFKLKISKEMKNAIIRTDLAHPNRIFAITNKKFEGRSEVREIYNWIRGLNDELFELEAEKSLNRTFLDSYFGRVLTPEARTAFAAINQGAVDVLGKSKHLKTYSAFMKERVLTDLSTPEVNELFRLIHKTSKDSKFSGEELIEEIVDTVKDRFKKNVQDGGKRIDDLELSAEQVERYRAIANHMADHGNPSRMDFFHINPLMATKLRFEQSLKARRDVELLETLDKSGSGLVVGAEDIEKITNKTKRVDRLLKSRQRVDAQIAETKAAIASTDPVEIDELARLDTRLKTLDARQTAKQIEIDELEAFKIKTHGPAVADLEISNGRVYVPRAQMDKLIMDGAIDPKDLPFGSDMDMVAVDYLRHKATLQKTGTKVVLFNPDAEVLARQFFGVTADSAKLGKFLEKWDWVHDLWRSWTLFPIPAYHARNILSSFNMAWLGGVDDVNDYRDSMRIWNIIKQKRSGKISIQEADEFLEEISFSSGGVVKNGREMLEEFHHRGGTVGGFFYNEFNRYGLAKRRSEFERKMNSIGIDSIGETTLTGGLVDNSAIRAGSRFGQYIENNFRMSAFINHWRKTGSLDDAEKMMKAIFYDYRNMSVAERDGLRRIVPFYSWTRQNTPRMIETMIMDPIKHVRLHRFLRSVQQGALEGQPPDEEGLSDWAKDNFGVIMEKDKNGHYFIKNAAGIFPAYDVFRFAKTFGRGDVLEGVSTELGVTPFIKYPIENLLNRSSFFQRDLESFPGELSRKQFTLGRAGFTRRDQVLAGNSVNPFKMVMNDQFIQSFFRAGNVAATTLEDLLDPRIKDKSGMAMFSLLIGRGQTVDPEAVRSSQMRRASAIVNKMKSKVKQAEDLGNKSYANQIRQQIIDYTLRYGGGSR